MKESEPVRFANLVFKQFAKLKSTFNGHVC